jgi:hypothetical protein
MATMKPFKATKKELYSVLNKALFNYLILFTREYLFEIVYSVFYFSMIGVTIGFPSLSSSGVRPPEYPSS